MPIEQTVASYSPHVRSIVRIVVALLFLEHGLSRLFGWRHRSDEVGRC
jgi:uncharacterized membrane protein YphA (DoxX/SURF4 family)